MAQQTRSSILDLVHERHMMSVRKPWVVLLALALAAGCANGKKKPNPATNTNPNNGLNTGINNTGVTPGTPTRLVFKNGASPLTTLNVQVGRPVTITVEAACNQTTVTTTQCNTSSVTNIMVVSADPSVVDVQRSGTTGSSWIVTAKTQTTGGTTGTTGATAAASGKSTTLTATAGTLTGSMSVTVGSVNGSLGQLESISFQQGTATTVSENQTCLLTLVGTFKNTASTVAGAVQATPREVALTTRPEIMNQVTFTSSRPDLAQPPSQAKPDQCTPLKFPDQPETVTITASAGSAVCNSTTSTTGGNSCSATIAVTLSKTSASAGSTPTTTTTLPTANDVFDPKLSSSVFSGTGTCDITDIAGTPAATELEAFCKADIVSGRGETKRLEPDSTLSVAEYATIAANIAGKLDPNFKVPEATSVPPQIPADHWAANNIAWAMSQKGVLSTDAKADEPISREEAFAGLAALLKLTGGSVATLNAHFSDAQLIREERLSHIATALEHGCFRNLKQRRKTTVSSGNLDLLLPGVPVTRASFISCGYNMIMRRGSSSTTPASSTPTDTTSSSSNGSLPSDSLASNPSADPYI